MRALRTSLTDIHSYGTTVHMSIFSRRFMRRVQIMPALRLARSTGSQCQHAHSTDPYRARGIGNGNASNHEDPWLTARMRPAGRWAANRHKSRPHRRVTQSSFRLVSALSAAAPAHHTLPANGAHRAKELVKLLLPAKLMQPPLASTRAECSIPAPR